LATYFGPNTGTRYWLGAKIYTKIYKIYASGIRETQSGGESGKREFDPRTSTPFNLDATTPAAESNNRDHVTLSITMAGHTFRLDVNFLIRIDHPVFSKRPHILNSAISTLRRNVSAWMAGGPFLWMR
jgi:hypothetical protein